MIPREGLPMQDLAGCDYFRTPVIFQGLDNCNIVGVMNSAHHIIRPSWLLPLHKAFEIPLRPDSRFQIDPA
jgi:hypothetical protein